MTGLSFGIQKSDHNNELVVTDGRIPGGDSNIKRRGCLLRILKLTPKGDQSGRGSRIF